MEFARTALLTRMSSRQRSSRTRIEPLLFMPDSYGYRPDKSALDAIGVTRERCWRAALPCLNWRPLSIGRDARQISLITRNEDSGWPPCWPQLASRVTTVCIESPGDQSISFHEPFRMADKIGPPERV
jgi:hypothetical protein